MNQRRPITRALPLVGSAFFLTFAACAPVPPAKEPPGPMLGGVQAALGYLPSDALPNSLALVPPPPAAGSPAFANDEEVHRNAAPLRDTPRYRLAALDAELVFPRAADAFACTLGVPIDAEHTPRLYRLLHKTETDAGLSTSRAKNQYKRLRPFAAHNEPTCSAQDEARLRNNGSYPSGHAAIGWTWALVLAEVDPAHADAILARGRSYGESRIVCNVHWQSDVLEGRFLGASVTSRLHSIPQFRQDVQAAREDLVKARAQGLKPERDCAMEAEALQAKIPGVL